MKSAYRRTKGLSLLSLSAALLLDQTKAFSTFQQFYSLSHVSQINTLHRRSEYHQFSRLYANLPKDPQEMTREFLTSLKVKELKDKIKALNTDVKISQLKLKADCVDYLYNYYQENNADISDTSDGNMASPSISKEPMKRKARRMPPLESSVNVGTSTNEEKTVLTSPKDIIFEEVFQRYPPVRSLQNVLEGGAKSEELLNNDELAPHMHPSVYKSFSGLGEMDVRQNYHPMLKDMTSSDLDLITVGTASCVPGVTRGVSCTALRLQWRRNNNFKNQKGNKGNDPVTGGIWIFDCGESTQLQIQRTGSIRPGKISKIFVTHAHGDHSFGLPGLMCIMGQDRDRDGPPLEIYGPEGLRTWLRTCIRYSVSRIVPPYRVHEIMDIPMAPEWGQGRMRNGRYYYQTDFRNKQQQNRRKVWGTQGLAGEDPVSWISRAPMINLERSEQFGEIDGGRDIYPVYNHPKCVDGAPIWEIEDEGDVRVYAAPMSHGVPCVGYVVDEQNKPGRLRNDLVEPIAKRNIKALKESGMKTPMKIMATIKDLPKGGSYTFPDGTVVKQEEVVEPPREGRKVVICGDTADSRAIAGLAQGADVLVHEATNAFLSGIDRDTSKAETRRDAQIHGHSTPSIAGEFAKEIGAKRLVLNHFSSRYKGDQSLESMSIMTRIEQEAIKASGLSEDKVVAAWDFMIMPVPQN